MSEHSVSPEGPQGMVCPHSVPVGGPREGVCVGVLRRIKDVQEKPSATPSSPPSPDPEARSQCQEQDSEFSVGGKGAEVSWEAERRTGKRTVGTHSFRLTTWLQVDITGAGLAVSKRTGEGSCPLSSGSTVSPAPRGPAQ